MIKSYNNFLLASDMDGTLIGTDGRISEENKQALADFTARGGHFAIATGRTPSNAAPFLTDLAINTPCIFYNGAMLYDWNKKKILQTSALEGPLWRDFAAELLRRFPTACIEAYTAEECYVLSDPAQDDPRLESEHHAYKHASLGQVKDEVWLKFFISASREAELGMLAVAKEMGIDRMSTSFFSSTTYLEFVRLGTSKGSMLTALRELPENRGRIVVAAGDFGNDTEMLRRADHGVAPANADDGTKRAADFIGVSCDEHLMRQIVEEVMPGLV